MELQTFNFESQEVRTVIKNNEPWFIGNDLAEVLGYKNKSDALQKHIDKEDKDEIAIRDSIGRMQNTPIVNESGMYALIFGSKLPKAKEFKRWVTSEVLPSIRKHGMYATENTVEQMLNDPDMAIQLLETIKQERAEKALLEQQIAEYEPKISYLDTILSSKDTVTITQIAADYGMSAQAMNKLLNELNVQHKVGGQWILYRKHMRHGYTKSHTTEITKADGTSMVVMNTKWTQKGRLFLYELLKDEEIYPQMDLELEEV